MLKPNACPCCKHLTIEESGNWEICKVCFWEDDNDTGANGVSLEEAKANYAEFGVSELRFKRFVRSPTLEEIPKDAKT